MYCQFDVIACVPTCDDLMRDCVIYFTSMRQIVLGGLITGGWGTWIMEMEIIMMDRTMEMEITMY